MTSAIVLAGRENAGKLKDMSTEQWEAMIPVAGRPMLQWVLDAVNASTEVGRVIVVGPEDALRDRVQCRDLSFAAPRGSIVDNVRAGLTQLPPDDMVIIITSDIPLITGATIDGFLAECRAAGSAELYYPILERHTMEGRYPTTKRTYAKLVEGTFTGGNFFVIRAGRVEQLAELADKFVGARKNVLQMASLLGWTFLVRLALGRAHLQQIVDKAVKVLGFPARAVISEQAPMGIDVDKPSDFELATAELTAR